MIFGLLLLIALLAFIVWDSRRLKQRSDPIPRERMTSGFQPKGANRWHLCIGFGVVSLALALAEWFHPRRPPFRGLWGWLYQFAYSALGTHGILALLIITAAACFCLGFSLRREEPK